MNACGIHSSHFRAKEPIHDDVMIDIANKQKSVPNDCIEACSFQKAAFPY